MDVRFPFLDEDAFTWLGIKPPLRHILSGADGADGARLVIGGSQLLSILLGVCRFVPGFLLAHSTLRSSVDDGTPFGLTPFGCAAVVGKHFNAAPPI